MFFVVAGNAKQGVLWGGSWRVEVVSDGVMLCDEETFLF